MTLHAHSGRGRGYFFLLFALSGFSGLIYESVWTQYIKLFLGHAAYAQTLVLAIFMGGMGLGSWLAARYAVRWKNLLLAYAVAEGLIGLAALQFHRAFVGATGVAYDALLPQLGSPALAHAVKWALSAAFILPQSILLGMTFPLMSGGIIRRYPGTPGASLGMLYFSNSFGAALGVLACGFLLIGNIGLPGSMMTAGLINIVLALLVWLLVRDQSIVPGEQPPAPAVPVSQADAGLRLMLLAAAVTGAASFLYEIAWIRGLTLVLGASTHAFELMLSAFILGLALGGLWIRRRIDGLADPLRFLARVQVLMGLLALATLPLLSVVFELMQSIMAGVAKTEQGYQVFNLLSHLLCLLLMLPATFMAGMTLPLMTFVLLRRGVGEKSIGAVYAANTLGAIAGVLVAVHVLMTLVGIKGIICIGALLDVALGLWLFRTVPWQARRLELPAQALVGGAALVLTVLMVQLDPKQLLSGVYRAGHASLPEFVSVLFQRDGKTATVGLTQWPNGQIVLSTNGKADASINLVGDEPTLDEPTAVLLAALGLAMTPEPKQAANIGMGSGLTTQVLLSSQLLTRVDTIEIEAAMVEAAKRFRPRVDRTFSDPRSHVYVEDAKTFFSTRRERYDIIVSEPSNPWVSGVASLFSGEFYRHIRGHLRPDGVLVQWVQLYDIDLSILASVVKALSANFSDYAIYNSNDLDILIVAKRDGVLPPIDPRVVRSPGLERELRRVKVAGIQDLEARKIGTKRTLDPLFRSYGVPANSDYFPYVDQNAARTRFSKVSGQSLASMTVHFLPVMEMLDDLPQGGASARPTANALLRKVRAITDAYMLRDLLVERRYADLPASLPPDALMPHLMLQACTAPGSEGLWIDSLLEQAGRLVPHLAANEVEPVWQRLEAASCFPKLSQRQRAWFQLVRDISRRDAGAMADQATRVLESGYTGRQASRIRFAVMAGMLGYLARGMPDQAAALWEHYGTEVLPAANPPLEVRLLLAMAGARSEAPTTANAGHATRLTAAK